MKCWRTVLAWLLVLVMITSAACTGHKPAESDLSGGEESTMSTSNIGSTGNASGTGTVDSAAGTDVANSTISASNTTGVSSVVNQSSETSTTQPTADNTFKNPMSSKGADPFVTYYDGYYYCVFTLGDRITIYRSTTLKKLLMQDFKKVYTAGKEVQSCIWAPEMYRIGNRWYIYSSGATSGNDFNSIRMFCLESVTDDPFGEYVFKGFTDSKLYAIDQTVYYDEEAQKQYIAYVTVTAQLGNAIYIAEMDNPWTIGEKRALISTAKYPWEIRKGHINEAPFFLKKDDKLFIIYSANHTDSVDYCLGRLDYKGGDLVKTDSWEKYTKAVFKSSDKLFSVGHCSIFQSPDKTEYWIAYHARTSPYDTNRRLCIQKFTFDENGYPDFGTPIADVYMTPPSGE